MIVSSLYGSGDAQGALGGLLGISPLAIAKVVETLKASGIDLPAGVAPSGGKAVSMIIYGGPGPDSRSRRQRAA